MPRELTANLNTAKNKQANKPVELYLLYLDSGTLYLTDCQEPVEFFDEEGSPQIYQPWGVERGEIQTGSESRVNQVTLRFDNVNRTFFDILATEDMRRRRVEIWQVFLEEISSPADRIIKFAGHLDGPSISEKELEVNAYERFEMYEIQIPRRSFQINCPWVFGGPECGISAPTATGAIDSSGENNYVLYSGDLGQEAGTWVNGFIIVEGEGRQVVASEPGEVTVNMPFFTDPVGKGFTVKAGCNKAIADCQAWGNEEFFGGFLYVPESRRRD